MGSFNIMLFFFSLKFFVFMKIVIIQGVSYQLRCKYGRNYMVKVNETKPA